MFSSMIKLGIILFALTPVTHLCMDPPLPPSSPKLDRTPQSPPRSTRPSLPANMQPFDRQLLFAAADGQAAQMIRALEAGANRDVTDGSGLRALHWAAQNGHHECVRRLLERQTPIDAVTNDNSTALFLASTNGHENIVRLLLERQANRSIKNSKGQLPLHRAAHAGHKDIVELLLPPRTGALAFLNNEVDETTNEGETALHLASAQGHTEVMRFLIEQRQANISAKTTARDGKPLSGVAPIHLASNGGHGQAVVLLIKTKADIVKIKDAAGQNALHFAAYRGHEEIVRLLAGYQTTVNEENSEGYTPLYYAAKAGHSSIAQILKDNSARLETNKKAIPLLVAAQNDRTLVVRCLLSAGANQDTTDSTGMTALYAASQQGHLDVVKILLGANAQADLRHKDQFTPLIVAAGQGHLPVVECLLDIRGGLNVIINDAHTALTQALKNRHHAVVRFLLERGARIDFPRIRDSIRSELETRFAREPIFLAALYGNTDAILALLTEETDCSTLEDPLKVALGQGHADVVTTLLNHIINNNPDDISTLSRYLQVAEARFNNPDPTITADRKLAYQSILSRIRTQISDQCRTAINNGKIEKAIALRGDVNNAAHNGETLLHEAARHNKVEAVNQLLARGAHPNRASSANKTPLQLAAAKSHFEVVKTLIKAGALFDKNDQEVKKVLGFICNNEQFFLVSLTGDATEEQVGQLALRREPLALQLGLAYAIAQNHDKVASKIIEILRKKRLLDLINDSLTIIDSFQKSQDPLLKERNYGKFRDIIQNAFNEALADAESCQHINEALRYGGRINVPLRIPALHASVQRGNIDMVRLLLDRAADVTAISYEGMTPLHDAACSSTDQTPIVQLLLERRAVIDAQVRADNPHEAGNTALHCAVNRGHRAIAQLLISRGSPLHIKNSRKQTPLDCAFTKKDKHLIECLLQLGAPFDPALLPPDVEFPGRELFQAIVTGNSPQLAPALREIENHHIIREALSYALTQRHADSIKILSNRLATIPDVEFLVTQYRAEKNNAAAAKEPTILNHLRDALITALLLAVNKQNENFVKLILESGISGDEITAGDTPLSVALSRGFENIAIALLEGKVDPNKAAPGRDKPLSISASKGYDHIVKLLLERGAHINAKSNSQLTPLQEAAHHHEELNDRYHATARVLLEHGAEFAGQDSKCTSLLEREQPALRRIIRDNLPPLPQMLISKKDESRFLGKILLHALVYGNIAAAQTIVPFFIDHHGIEDLQLYLQKVLLLIARVDPTISIARRNNYPVLVSYLIDVIKEFEKNERHIHPQLRNESSFLGKFLLHAIVYGDIATVKTIAPFFIDHHGIEELRPYLQKVLLFIAKSDPTVSIARRNNYPVIVSYLTDVIEQFEKKAKLIHRQLLPVQPEPQDTYLSRARQAVNHAVQVYLNGLAHRSPHVEIIRRLLQTPGHQPTVLNNALRLLRERQKSNRGDEEQEVYITLENLLQPPHEELTPMQAIESIRNLLRQIINQQPHSKEIATYKTLLDRFNSLKLEAHGRNDFITHNDVLRETHRLLKERMSLSLSKNDKSNYHKILNIIWHVIPELRFNRTLPEEMVNRILSYTVLNVNPNK